MTGTSYVATGLTAGTSYSFKVNARNKYGYSDQSLSLTVLCAYKPNKPVAPVTAIATNTVVLTWTAPNSNGSPITKYTVLIKDHSGTFKPDLADCNGSA